MSHAILVVDDDEIFSTVLAKVLQRKGYQVLCAKNSAEARHYMQTQQPAWCILDLKIANESGLKLLPQLLTDSPSVKILVLTGYASIATAVEAVKLGAVNYLSKPVEVDDIIKALSDINVTETQRNDDEMNDQPMSVDRLEWEHIQKVLTENAGNISETARLLGMHRRTLQRKLQKKPVKH
jgi:two-component system response regulator RegA